LLLQDESQHFSRIFVIIDCQYPYASETIKRIH